jgi:molecular chaperone IbpA
MPIGSYKRAKSPKRSCLIKEKNMNALTRFDTQALNRALVGFDRIFDNLETRYGNQINQNYPPYNIEKVGDNLYDIVIAVAGFSKEEVTVEVDQDQLIVRGQKTQQDSDTEYLHRGLAFRDFERRFVLAEHMEVVRAETKNGLLMIQIERRVPEALLPCKIEVIELKD